MALMVADLPAPGTPVTRKFGLVINPRRSHSSGWQENAPPDRQSTPMYAPTGGMVAPYSHGYRPCTWAVEPRNVGGAGTRGARPANGLAQPRRGATRSAGGRGARSFVSGLVSPVAAGGGG